MRKLPIILFLYSLATIVSANDIGNSYINELNKAINNKKYYDEKKEQKINSLKQLLHISDLSLAQEYDINFKLSKEYRKYRMDSAVYYMEKNQDIAKKLNSMDVINETNLNLSLLYSATGMYLEAKDILNHIDRKSLSEKLVPLYFESNSQFYGHYAQSNDRHAYF